MRFQRNALETGLASTSMAGLAVQARSMLNQRPAGGPQLAVIAEGINIHGCVQTDGEVQVDGTIHGDVRCKHLTIGKSGMILGDILATDLVIRGKLKGAIRAQRVIIQEGAHVESDVSHETFAMEEGAYFKGCCMPTTVKEMAVPGPEPAPVALHVIEESKAVDA